MNAASVTDIPRFILASASPRRRQLLEEAGYRFEVRPSLVDEPAPAGFDTPEGYVAHTAWMKATWGTESEQGESLILAADTVTCLDGAILGKPIDRDDARRILKQLQGTRHAVHTGVCVWLGKLGMTLSLVETSVVVMRPLDDVTLDNYLSTDRWHGKAGGYGVQDKDDPFVDVIEGSYSNVVGLPMERVARLLALAGNLSAPG